MKKMWLTGVTLTVLALSAAEIKVTGQADRESALYEIGETITFTFTGVPAQLNCNAALSGDRSIEKSFKVTADDAGKVTVKTALRQPGFVLCRLSGAGFKPVSAGAGVQPLELTPARPMPPDFTAYWNAQKLPLQKTPLAPQLTEVSKPADKYAVYDLSLPCPGSRTPVRGYFALRRGAKPKSCPAILTLHGAGVGDSWRSTAASFANQGFISLNINAHGIDNGQPKLYYQTLRNTSLARYWHVGADSLESNYFRPMFLRVYRALQFLQSRPEWDGKTLVAWGSSQGGMQALAAGGLEPRVSAVVAFVAAGCDHGGYAVGRRSGWPGYCYTSAYKKAPAQVLKTVDYIDCANFARQLVNTEVFMSAGFIDTTCSPGSVYAAFNAIPSRRKQMCNGVAAGHRVFPASSSAAAAFLKAHVARSAAK